MIYMAQDLFEDELYKMEDKKSKCCDAQQYVIKRNDDHMVSDDNTTHFIICEECGKEIEVRMKSRLVGLTTEQLILKLIEADQRFQTARYNYLRAFCCSGNMTNMTAIKLSRKMQDALIKRRKVEYIIRNRISKRK